MLATFRQVLSKMPSAGAQGSLLSRRPDVVRDPIPEAHSGASPQGSSVDDQIGRELPESTASPPTTSAEAAAMADPLSSHALHDDQATAEEISEAMLRLPALVSRADTGDEMEALPDMIALIKEIEEQLELMGFKTY